MESKTVKRILHAKDSQAKLAFFHNEIINRLENSEKAGRGAKCAPHDFRCAKTSLRDADIFRSLLLAQAARITVVNMPEFGLIGDTRITIREIDEIATVQPEQTLFIFNVFPNKTLIDTLGRLDCKEINVAVVDFSAIYSSLFTKNGFDALYINDNYLDESPVFGSVPELNAALLRTII